MVVIAKNGPPPAPRPPISLQNYSSYQVDAAIKAVKIDSMSMS